MHRPFIDQNLDKYFEERERIVRDSPVLVVRAGFLEGVALKQGCEEGGMSKMWLARRGGALPDHFLQKRPLFASFGRIPCSNDDNTLEKHMDGRLEKRPL